MSIQSVKEINPNLSKKLPININLKNRVSKEERMTNRNKKKNANESDLLDYGGDINENCWGFGHLDDGRSAIWQSTGLAFKEGDSKTYSTFILQKIMKLEEKSITVNFYLFF